MGNKLINSARGVIGNGCCGNHSRPERFREKTRKSPFHHKNLEAFHVDCSSRRVSDVNLFMLKLSTLVKVDFHVEVDVLTARDFCKAQQRRSLKQSSVAEC